MAISTKKARHEHYRNHLQHSKQKFHADALRETLLLKILNSFHSVQKR